MQFLALNPPPYVSSCGLKAGDYEGPMIHITFIKPFSDHRVNEEILEEINPINIELFHHGTKVIPSNNCPWICVHFPSNGTSGPGKPPQGRATGSTDTLGQGFRYSFSFITSLSVLPMCVLDLFPHEGPSAVTRDDLTEQQYVSFSACRDSKGMIEINLCVLQVLSKGNQSWLNCAMTSISASGNSHHYLI